MFKIGIKLGSLNKILKDMVDLKDFETRHLINKGLKQIKKAFETAQHEVDFLHKRTSEGIAVARAKGKQIGRTTGTKVETKKAKASKEKINCLAFIPKNILSV